LFAGILISSGATSATIFEGEQGETLDLSGRFETGGYFGRKYNDVGDKWTYGSGYVDDSFMSFAITGRTGQVYTRLEFDIERMNWTVDNEFQHVVDKAYAGWDFGNGHKIEVGRTDTAYDRYDSFGDFSVYGDSVTADVSEAGDQDSTIKYEGEFMGVRMGISHSEEGWDENETDSREDRVVNGYVGYFAQSFAVLAGVEEVDNRGTIYSLHGEAYLGDFALGGLYSSSDREEREAYNTLDSELQLISAKYNVTPKWMIAVTYSELDVEFETIETTESGFRVWIDDEWTEVSTEYAYRSNVTFKLQLAQGGESGSYAYGKLVYRF
jgi:hypothetical protein